LKHEIQKCYIRVARQKVDLEVPTRRLPLLNSIFFTHYSPL
jgi:hypothetical protein